MRQITLHLTMGLPRSGKSSWAKTTGFPMVNRDSIRLALHGERYLQQAEEMVTVLEETMVRSLILAGHNDIVIDATHLSAKYVEKWMTLRCPNVSAICVLPVRFPAGPDICIHRAKASGREDLVPVIEAMMERYYPDNPWIGNNR